MITHHPLPVRLTALVAAVALALGSWSPLAACGCAPCGAALEGCSSGCCSAKSLCQSCCDRQGEDESPADCLADGGCLCHPVSAPTSEQPRVPQSDQVAQAFVVLPSAISALPSLIEPTAVVAAPPLSRSGAELRVLYCSRLE